ncbi:hypothetical protein [Vulcanisaeta moutnovskia]|nr:hypothetical protein [Vulcanisaeta moutnovskia]
MGYGRNNTVPAASKQLFLLIDPRQAAMHPAAFLSPAGITNW